MFDVGGFLKCLAYNQAMVNWDSYGIMPHNYYIYADPSNDGKITWFPWDLNEALLIGGMGSNTAESVMLDEVGGNWPMIRLLLDDSTYRTQYQAHLASALETGFEMDFVNAKSLTSFVAFLLRSPESLALPASMKSFSHL